MAAAATDGGLSHAAGRPAADPDAARPALAGFWAAERGATAIEYALIASIISIVGVTAFTSIGQSLLAMFQKVQF
jgi:Flp pilus assembly pilin Flp